MRRPRSRHDEIAAAIAEKVALFRSLFRGCDDVYPRLWQNPRTGKKGYAPACAEEWVRGVAVDDIVPSYGHAIVDECHHVPAVSFERVLSAVKAQYVTGLTATPTTSGCFCTPTAAACAA